MKKLYSFNIDPDLLSRAKEVAIFRKTTVSSIITQSLLEAVEYYERLSESQRWDFRYNKTRPSKRIPPSLRNKIRERDKLTCQECNITQKEWQAQHPELKRFPNEYVLHVTHIEAQANFSNPEESMAENNLRLLCPTCHRKEHRIQSNYLHYNKF